MRDRGKGEVGDDGEVGGERREQPTDILSTCWDVVPFPFWTSFKKYPWMN
jgi:hypothetical protein